MKEDYNFLGSSDDDEWDDLRDELHLIRDQLDASNQYLEAIDYKLKASAENQTTLIYTIWGIGGFMIASTLGQVWPVIAVYISYRILKFAFGRLKESWREKILNIVGNIIIFIIGTAIIVGIAWLAWSIWILILPFINEFNINHP